MGSRLHSVTAIFTPVCIVNFNQEDQMTTYETQSIPNDMSGARPSPAAFSPIRVLVVDDHPAVRLGLRKLLEDQPDLVLVAIVETAEAAISIAEREPVDVAVVDYQLGSRDGLWVSRKLKRLPEPPRVVLYSAYADGLLAAASVVAEADALVSKGGVGAELCDAIRGVARGRLLLPIVPQPLAAMMRARLEPPEQAIFGMLLAGIAPVEIAHTLDVSRADLDSRLWSLLRKVEALPVAGELHGTRARIGSRLLAARRNVAHSHA
jgi:DNA-binding NarL/FixJ family response regulator